MIENLQELAQTIVLHKGILQYYLLLLYKTYEERDVTSLILERELSHDFDVKQIQIPQEADDFIPDGLLQSLKNLQHTVKGKNPCAFIFGIEHIIPAGLRILNSNRELFRFNFPIVFWLSEHLEGKFEELAPDLFSFFWTDRFQVDLLNTELSNGELQELLKGFEEKYHTDSKNFYTAWEKGEFEETFETHDWATIYRLLHLRARE